MICRIFNRLYSLMPFTSWHALLIRLHFGRCPRCDREFDIDDEMKRVTLKPEQLPAGTDLWPPVRRLLAGQAQHQVGRVKRWLKLFDTVFLIFAVLILIIFAFLIVYFKFFEK